MYTQATKSRSARKPFAGAPGKQSIQLPAVAPKTETHSPVTQRKTEKEKSAYRPVQQTVQKQAVIQRVNHEWRDGWENTALGRLLTKDINPDDEHVVILQQLMTNFGRLGQQFNYTKHPASHDNFLQGTLVGDCGTLARAFQDIATGYYGIPGVDTDRWGDCWASAPPTPYGGRQPDCDGGSAWVFGSHTWAVHNGVVYDILFCTNQLAHHLDVTGNIRGLKGSVFPDDEASWLSDGSIIYSSGVVRWYRIPPDLASRVGYAVLYCPVGLFRVLRFILSGGLKLIKRYIDKLVNKIREKLGNDPDDDFGHLAVRTGEMYGKEKNV